MDGGAFLLVGVFELSAHRHDGLDDGDSGSDWRLA